MLRFEEVGKLLKETTGKIVGHEKGDLFLIAVDNEVEKKTSIFVYDYWKKKRELLYTHSCEMKCVNASLNWNRTALAFTCRVLPTHAVNLLPHSRVHVSYIVNLENNFAFKLDIQGRAYQAIQFISFPRNSSDCRFLFFRECESIAWYSLIMKKKQHLSIERISTFIHQYLWSYWDPKVDTLYFLQYNGPDKHNPLISDCRLYCYNFSNKKISNFAQFEYSLPILLPETVVTSIQTSELLYSQEETSEYPWKRGHVICHPDLLIQIVSLKESGICMCMQNPYLIGSKSISYTIYVLHHRKQLDLKFPIGDIESNIPDYRIYFGSVSDLLLVYVPEVHLRLIDCGVDHEPWEIIEFNGKSAGKLFHHQNHYGLLRLNSQRQNSSEGEIMLSLKKGILYEMDISSDRIYSWIEDNAYTSDTLIRLLHLAIVHLDDFDFTQRLVFLICTQRNFFILSDIFTEYILGTSYVKMLKNFNSNDREFFNILPISVLEHNYSNFETVTTTLKHREVIQYQQKFYVRAPPFSLTETLKSRMKHTQPNDQNLQELIRSTQSAPQNSKSASKKELFNRAIFGFLYSKSKDALDESAFESEKQDPEDPVREILKKMFFNALADILQSQFTNPSMRPKVTKWAREYTLVVSEMTEHLYQQIKNLGTYGNLNKKRSKFYFHLLENLHSCLEKTGFPTPTEFTLEFPLIGFQTQPAMSFYQYIQRNVYWVTPTLLRALMKQNIDDTLLALMVRKLFDMTHEMKFWKQTEEGRRLLLNHYCFHYRNYFNETNQQPSNESDGKFKPLQYFINVLEDEDKVELQQNNSGTKSTMTSRMKFIHENSWKMLNR